MVMNWYQNWIVKEYLKLRRRGFIGDVSTTKPAMIEKDIHYKDMYDILPKKYINPNNNTEYTTRTTFWDLNYRLTSVSEVKRFLAWDRTNNEKIYEKEFFDCDDYAVVLWGRMKMWTSGLAQGVIITIDPAHAKNIFIDNNLVVWEIEPQSDQVRELYSIVTHYLF
jgi:hypothetical protein